MNFFSIVSFLAVAFAFLAVSEAGLFGKDKLKGMYAKGLCDDVDYYPRHIYQQYIDGCYCPAPSDFQSNPKCNGKLL